MNQNCLIIKIAFIFAKLFIILLLRHIYKHILICYLLGLITGKNFFILIEELSRLKSFNKKKFKNFRSLHSSFMSNYVGDNSGIIKNVKIINKT